MAVDLDSVGVAGCLLLCAPACDLFHRSMNIHAWLSVGGGVLSPPTPAMRNIFSAGVGNTTVEVPPAGKATLIVALIVLAIPGTALAASDYCEPDRALYDPPD